MNSMVELRALVDLRQVLQKNRMGFDNRVRAIEQGVDDSTKDAEGRLYFWADRFREMEETADEQIKDLVKEIENEYPILEQIVQVKGIGRILAAKLISMIDIERAPMISSLWKFAGMGVTDGQRDRMVKGEKRSYNLRLKTVCYLIATSFMRSNSPYRAIYDKARVHYDKKKNKKNPEWTDGHKHQASLRKMIKVFLSHVWLRWRQIEGLAIVEPYAIAHLKKHTHYIAPEDMGWPKA